ncbi:NUDIX domain-containing protein [Candidatus Saccharibacteria bacterium]|nr:NUDIX domain-containing protein [Candidatus Saccharibacteria bacterium]
MHKDEIWQVYAPNGEAVVGEGWDSALGNPEETGANVIVGVSVVFVYRRNAEGVLELLWQRRSPEIDRYPNDYDISAGGHINLGETPVMGAMREAREEIGAEFDADELKFVTIRSFNDISRIAWIYAVDWTGKPETFHFDDKEVSEVRWVPFSETEEFRMNFAKKPLKKDGLTFELLGEWFKMNGIM